MKALLFELKEKKDKWAFPINTFTLEITEEMFKDFQKMVINWAPEDTNVFFNIEQ